MDPRFRVETISRTPNPQRTIYAAMHQDYAEGYVCDERDEWPDEEKAGEIIVKRLLAGERGHYGPLEHVSIVLNVGYFPHSVMQQARTHRLCSFDVQSGRYTGARVCAAASREVDIEEVFYLRPAGFYTDRNGRRYRYTEGSRDFDRSRCLSAAQHYSIEVNDLGYSEEHARGMLPFDIRQHFVLSFNLRSALHFMDLRSKKDAQLEIQWLCELIWPHIQEWVPAIAQWYEQTRLGKARLSP